MLVYIPAFPFSCIPLDHSHIPFYTDFTGFREEQSHTKLQTTVTEHSLLVVHLYYLTNVSKARDLSLAFQNLYKSTSFFFYPPDIQEIR